MVLINDSLKREREEEELLELPNGEDAACVT